MAVNSTYNNFSSLGNLKNELVKNFHVETVNLVHMRKDKNNFLKNSAYALEHAIKKGVLMVNCDLLDIFCYFKNFEKLVALFLIWRSIKLTSDISILLVYKTKQ